MLTEIIFSRSWYPKELQANSLGSASLLWERCINRYDSQFHQSVFESDGEDQISGRI